jgi:preprotein translocase subunit SecD
MELTEDKKRHAIITVIMGIAVVFALVIAYTYY